MSDIREFSSAQAKWKLLESVARFRAYEAGEIVIETDAEDDDIYLILNGAVKVTNFSLMGKEIWHDLLTAGTIFGELACLSGEPRSASVVAMEPSRMAVVTRDELFKLIKTDPDIAIWLLGELAHRLTKTSENVRALVSQNISQRVRRELIRLSRSPESGSSHFYIEPVPNLSEMARRLNTDRENVSREVSALVSRRVLKRTTQRLEILKLEYLENSSVL